MGTEGIVHRYYFVVGKMNAQRGQRFARHHRKIDKPRVKFISLGPVPVSLLTYLTIWDKYKWCLPLNHGFTFGKCFSPASPATWHQPLPKLSESWLTNRKGAGGSLAICRAEKLDAALEWRAPRLRLTRISKTEIKSISEANGKLNAELSTLSSEWKHHSQDN